MQKNPLFPQELTKLANQKFREREDGKEEMAWRVKRQVKRAKQEDPFPQRSDNRKWQNALLNEE